jgi:hypothetical protein
MTTLQISSHSSTRSVAEIVVAQTAFAMLRWSTRRSRHHATYSAVGLTHEQLQFRRKYELQRAQVPAGSGLVR